MTTMTTITKPAAEEEDTTTVTRLSRWEAKWENQQTNWHVTEVHPVLEKYLRRIKESSGTCTPSAAAPVRALFPLCGKSIDMEVLANRGYAVVGVDGCQDALTTFVKERGGNCSIINTNIGKSTNEHVSPHQTHQLATVQLPSSATLGYFVGDFLATTPHDLGGTFDLVFDRGSLVAVAPNDRDAYVNTLLTLITARTGRLLLVCVEHDPFANGHLGPPYSIPHDDVRTLFAATCSVEVLEREDRLHVEPVWKERGCTEFYETSYLLIKNETVV